jgi:hypothetical protein
MQSHLPEERIWYGHIQGGEEKESANIKQMVEEAQVAILLVSADYLASDLIREQQLPLLLDAAQVGRIRPLSIILSPCAFKYTQLAQYQVVNSPSEPMMGMAPYEQEVVWAKLIQQIQNIHSLPE